MESFLTYSKRWLPFSAYLHGFQVYLIRLDKKEQGLYMYKYQKYETELSVAYIVGLSRQKSQTPTSHKDTDFDPRFQNKAKSSVSSSVKF